MIKHIDCFTLENPSRIVAKLKKHLSALGRKANVDTIRFILCTTFFASKVSEKY